MEQKTQILSRIATGLAAMYGVYRLFLFVIQRLGAGELPGMEMLSALVLYGAGFLLLVRLAGPANADGSVGRAGIRPGAFLWIVLLQMFSLAIHLVLIQLELLLLQSPVTTPPVSFEGPWHLFLLLFLTPLFEELASERSRATGCFRNTKSSICLLRRCCLVWRTGLGPASRPSS